MRTRRLLGPGIGGLRDRGRQGQVKTFRLVSEIPEWAKNFANSAGFGHEIDGL